MTKLTEWGCSITAFLAIWLSLVYRKDYYFDNCDTVLYFFPVIIIFLFGYGMVEGRCTVERKYGKSSLCEIPPLLGSRSQDIRLHPQQSKMFSLIVVLWRVYCFNDCPEAAEEIKQQIQEARDDLKSKGLKF